jgi:hypothetical protein
MREILPFLLSTRQRENNLRDHIHRELVYRPLQFHKRSPHFIGVHNEPFSVVAMRVGDPDCSPARINR